MSTETEAPHKGPSGLHSYLHFPRRSKNKPYIKFPNALSAAETAPVPRADGSGPWNVHDLCAAYQWPSGLPGRGVIAIIELGGGWKQSDIALFFNTIGQPQPSITDVSVDGTQNAPGANLNSDTEVALDIQVAATSFYVATDQPATIRVYWATDIAAAVKAATADGCDVCSISWGSDEASWGPAEAAEMEQVAAAATQAGMILFAATGDNDSSDGGPSPANVDLPSTCPHIVACGGTTKTSTAETVWNNSPGNPNGNGTGGGFSTLFKPLPDWEIGAPNGPGRMIPDVAANADPNTGYNIAVNGTIAPVGGTSAVAPLYAGLFAAFGVKLGWITPQLWLNQVCFNDITSGDNGAYRATPGPDACSGIGSPIGTKLAALFTKSGGINTSLAQKNKQISDLMEENKQLHAALAASRNSQT